MGIDGPLFIVFKRIFNYIKQRVDGMFSQFKPVVSGVQQGSVLWSLLFILFTADMWNNFKNKIVSYADDTILYSEISTPSNCVQVTDYLNKFKLGDPPGR